MTTNTSSNNNPSNDCAVSQAIAKFDNSLAKLDELYTNLADQDAGDELLLILNNAMQDIRSAQALLNKA